MLSRLAPRGQGDSVANKSSWPVFVARELSASFLFWAGACPGPKRLRGSVSRGLGLYIDGRAIGSVSADAAWAIEDRQSVVCVPAYLDARIHEVRTQRTGLDLQTQLAEDDGVVVADDALLLMAQDLDQIAACPRHEGAAGLGRRHREAPVVHRQVDLAEKPVGRLDRRDAGVGKLLHQAILQGPEHPLGAAARLRRIGGNVADAELRQRAADLGEPALVDRLASLGGMEVMAAAIAVERTEQAMAADHLGKAAEARCRAFLIDEKPRVPLARRIVHRDDQVNLPLERRQPQMARAVLVQHHADQRTARPLLAVGRALRRRPHQTRNL